MDFADLETVYEALARALDRAGPKGRELFLAKLALMLANALDDREKVLAVIEACLREAGHLKDASPER